MCLKQRLLDSIFGSVQFSEKKKKYVKLQVEKVEKWQMKNASNAEIFNNLNYFYVTRQFTTKFLEIRRGKVF